MIRWREPFVLRRTSPVDNRTIYQGNKLEKNDDEFRAATLLQKCQQVDEQDSEADRLLQKSQLLYKAIRLGNQISSTSSSSKCLPSYGEKSEPLLDLDTVVTDSSIIGEKYG
jgi:hypothetical protein